jgi:hypothetical protein
LVIGGAMLPHAPQFFTMPRWCLANNRRAIGANSARPIDAIGASRGLSVVRDGERTQTNYNANASRLIMIPSIFDNKVGRQHRT